MAKKKEQEGSEILSRGEHFFEKYANLLFYIGLGIVILAFGVWAYFEYVAKPRRVAAQEALMTTEHYFIQGDNDLVLLSDGASGQGALNVAKEYSGTKSAELAHLYAGIAYFDQGQYKDALKELKKYSSKDPLVGPSVLRLMGDCCVELNKYDDAVKYFRQAADKADNAVISPSALIKAARVREAQQQYDKAIKLYKEVEEKYYDSPEASSVVADIIRLEALK